MQKILAVRNAFMVTDVVILTAGLGLRLKPITDHAPKCLTEVNGVPILINTLLNLATIGMRSCTLVTGYLSDVISRTVGKQFQNLEIEYVYNPLYESTNDLYSLWLARHRLRGGILLLEGDIFFRTQTLERILAGAGNRSFYIAGKYNGKSDEILIKTDRNRRIRSVEILTGRRGEIGNFYFMSTGMLIIQKDYGEQFSRWLDAFVQQNRVGVLFDAVISEHIDQFPLYVAEIDHTEWVEIDTIDDLERAESIFK